MDGFEHSVVAADIHGRKKTQAADKATCQVGNDVAVKIRHDHDIEVFGMHDQLHARVVYDFVITFNLGIFFGYIAENGQEHAIAEFHDIGFVDAGHFMTIMGQGVLKAARMMRLLA